MRTTRPVTAIVAGALSLVLLGACGSSSTRATSRATSRTPSAAAPTPARVTAKLAACLERNGLTAAEVEQLERGPGAKPSGARPTGAPSSGAAPRNAAKAMAACGATPAAGSARGGGPLE